MCGGPVGAPKAGCRRLKPDGARKGDVAIEVITPVPVARALLPKRGRQFS